MSKLCPVPILLAGILLSTNVKSVIIHVPDDQPNIQAGIDASVNGDTVLIADGIYTGDGNRDITFSGKAITVMSENGPENAVIDCEGSEADPHRGFILSNNETSNSILLGLTIKNGYTTEHGKGGGILCENASPLIDNCIIEGNKAYQGGGIYSSAETIVRNCHIKENTAAFGGGMYCNEDTDSIETTLFTDNYAYFNGGGLYTYYCESTTITDCTFSWNTADQDGGGIFCWESSVHINCATVTDNTSTWRYGGGICDRFGSSRITDSIISRNTSETGGGGIWVYQDNIIIINNLISENVTNGDGGGIWLASSGFNILGNTIMMNTSIQSGGGIFVWDNSGFIGNNLIAENTGRMGGGIYLLGNAEVSMQNCSIWENVSSEPGGGGVDCQGSTPIVVTDSILWTNTEPQITGLYDISYSNVQGGVPGEGNIDADPLFVTGSFGDFYLSHTACGQPEDSPCINSGSDLAVNICFELPDEEICLNELTTRTDQLTDTGQADIGYHYPIADCIHHGDVNFSGDITAGDAQLAFLIALGIHNPTFIEECAADCNGNEVVTVGDAQTIFAVILSQDFCMDPI